MKTRPGQCPICCHMNVFVYVRGRTQPRQQCRRQRVPAPALEGGGWHIPTASEVDTWPGDGTGGQDRRGARGEGGQLQGRHAGAGGRQGLRLGGGGLPWVSKWGRRIRITTLRRGVQM